MASAQQNRDFTTAVVSQYPLDEAIDWIRSNMEPEDVFEPETLLAWAKENAPSPEEICSQRDLENWAEENGFTQA